MEHEGLPAEDTVETNSSFWYLILGEFDESERKSMSIMIATHD